MDVCINFKNSLSIHFNIFMLFELRVPLRYHFRLQWVCWVKFSIALFIFRKKTLLYSIVDIFCWVQFVTAYFVFASFFLLFQVYIFFRAYFYPTLRALFACFPWKTWILNVLTENTYPQCKCVSFLSHNLLKFLYIFKLDEKFKFFFWPGLGILNNFIFESISYW